MRTTWPHTSAPGFVDASDLSEFSSWKSWLAAQKAQVEEHLSEITLTTSEPIRTTWRSGGQPHEVVTYWNGTETTQEWVDRHFKAVEDEMANYPPS